MKTFSRLVLSILALALAVAHGGALHVSNSKGFDSNPLVDNSGTILTDNNPVMIAIGTFASEPATALPGTEVGIDRTTYATLLAGFTPYGDPVGLEATLPPLSRRGTFVFQDSQAVAESPLANKPVYLLIAKGASFATATEIAILRTNEVFEAADDINPIPKLVGVGTDLGSVVIVGSALRFTAAPTGMSSTLRPAYSLAVILPPAEIVVEQQPAGNELLDGAATIDFGLVAAGSQSERTFKIRNTGESSLELNGLPRIELSGPAADQFEVTVPPASPVLPGQETFFTVRFTATLSGIANATLQIASNDADENPFDITLAGQALSPNDDTDGDGLNDAAEFRLAPLGYNWEVNQSELVDLLFTHSNLAGLYTEEQVHALHADTPLITRDASTGRFSLLMDWKKSVDLQNFSDFPAQPADVSVNPEGDILFEFTSPDDAAFFRIEIE